MARKRTGRAGAKKGLRKRKRFEGTRTYFRRKVCRFCTGEGTVPDYKDSPRLSKFTTERGKIIPRRISGNCAKHQRKITEAIKRARYIALLTFVSN